MRCQPRFGPSALLAIVLALGIAVSASGQTAQPPSPQATPAEPSGPVRQLSIEEAVNLALEQNLGIQVERVNPLLQDLSVAQVLTNYTPRLSSSFSSRNQSQPPNSFLSGGQTVITNDSLGVSAGFGKLFSWGTDASVFWDSGRATTNNIFSNFDPSLSGNVDLVVTQPLLRNFGIDGVRQQLAVSRENREIAGVDLQQAIAGTSRSVKNAYWDYVYAINSLAVARQSLELAQESLRNTRSRVEIGTLAPIDVVEAEAEVATREEAVILAEAAIGRAEDQLRTLIFDPKTPDFWNMRIQPTDAAPFQLQAVDVQGAVSRALGERTDLVSARKRLNITDVNLKYYRNQTLPALDLRFDYNTTGIGGTQFVREGDTFPPPIVGEIKRSWSDLMGDVLKSEFPTWQVSLNVSYPIGQSSAEASLARTRLERTQSETSIRQLELQVATQVRDAARTLTTNAKRVEATRAARVLAERRLEAEEKKFAAGMSTSFLVFQAQRDLAQARDNELRAVLDYNKSQVDFETVQVAPLGGGGGGASFSGGSVGGSAGVTTGGGGGQQ